jgi:hypothetical protein
MNVYIHTGFAGYTISPTRKYNSLHDNKSLQVSLTTRTQAHLPRRAMIPVPSSMHVSAYASFAFELFIISLLKRNSCARSCVRVVSQNLPRDSKASRIRTSRTSTRPVYKRIPALIESSTPLTIEAVVLSGL